MVKVNKLKNDIPVIMEKVDHVHSVQIGIFLRVGGVDEDEYNLGISHFIEHMMFKGTKKRSALEIAEEVERVGSSQNAYTSKQLTCYHIKSLKEELPKSVDILYDMLTNSVFDTAELNRERNVIIEEKKMYEDSPDDVVFEMIADLVFQGHPYGNEIIGTNESINRIDHDMIVDYVREHYNASSMVVSVSGNFEEAELLSMLEDTFGTIESGDYTRVLPPADYTPGTNSKVMDIQQTHLCLGAKGVKIGSDDYYDMTIYAGILGGSMSSRLFQKVREEKGLCYAVTAIPDCYVEDGAFYIYSAVADDNIEIAIEAIIGEIERMLEGITDEELTKAKNLMKASYTFSYESLNSRMNALGKNYLLLGKYFSEEEVLDGISKVTKESVLNIAKR
ncbi:MAG: insulinase family protein, partial [Clostridiales Family XIII bacterium]|nr:insulinase family protein [Clostridiales Family XIII bacterium]